MVAALVLTVVAILHFKEETYAHFEVAAVLQRKPVCILKIVFYWQLLIVW